MRRQKIFALVRVATAALLFLVAIPGLAQVYTGSLFRSRVADSTAVSVPTGYGGFYYNSQAGQLRLKDAAGWFNPRVAGVGANVLRSNYDNTFLGNTRFNLDGNSFNLTSTLTGFKFRLGYINGLTDATAWGLFAGNGTNVHNDSTNTVIAVAQELASVRAYNSATGHTSLLQIQPDGYSLFSTEGGYVSSEDSVTISSSVNHYIRTYPDSIRLFGNVKVFEPVTYQNVANKKYVDDAVAGGGSVTSIGTTSPITGGTITTTGTIGISDASTVAKGAASFNAPDFDTSSGNVSLDYTNGQVASGSTKGFLTSADWTTFNAKQAALVSGTNIKTINSTSLLGSGDIAISGSVSDGDKGDITVSSTGAVWKIDPGTADQALYTNAGATAVEWRNTLANPLTTDYDMYYWLSGALARLPKGANGQFLTTQSGALSWANSLSVPTTTGTGTSAGLNVVANSLTTGNAVELSSSSITTGNVLSVAATGTAAASNTKVAGRFATSGANGASSQSTFGGVFTNTSTGTTSTNIGGYFSASGGTTNKAVQIGNGIFEQIRTSDFSSAVTMQSVLNNTSTEIFNLASSGVSTWNLYNTTGTKIGDIIYTLSGGTNPGIVIRNGGATTRYNILHDPANDALTISENTIANTKVVVGGTAAPSATLEVIGRGTTTGIAFKVGNSSQATRLSIADDGTAGHQGPFFNFGNGTSAGKIRILEPSASGTDYTELTAQAQSAVISLTFPAAAPVSVGQALTVSNLTGNILSWATIMGGSTGATDNRLLRADGTGGSTVQNSAITVDDNGDAVIGTTGTRSVTSGGSVLRLNSEVASPTTVDIGGSTMTLYVPGSGTAVTIGKTQVTFNDPAGDRIISIAGTSGTAADDLILRSSSVTGGGNFKGGDVLLEAGANTGSGVPGKVTVNSVFTIKGYTVATLPAGTVGDTAYVTDALAPTWLVAVTGGGAIVTPVFYNGTNWVAH